MKVTNAESLEDRLEGGGEQNQEALTFGGKPTKQECDKQERQTEEEQGQQEGGGREEQYRAGL